MGLPLYIRDVVTSSFSWNPVPGTVRSQRERVYLRELNSQTKRETLQNSFGNGAIRAQYSYREKECVREWTKQRVGLSLYI